MFYDSACLKGLHGLLFLVLVSGCDDFECCYVTSMTHRATWRNRWHHKSTHRMHFPKGSLLDTNP